MGLGAAGPAASCSLPAPPRPAATHGMRLWGRGQRGTGASVGPVLGSDPPGVAGKAESGAGRG